jgi:CxxC motif-containing protein (DUF1111 family)
MIGLGLGLLEAVPERAALANASPDDLDNSGIYCPPNRVWDHALQVRFISQRFEDTAD